MSLLYNRWQEKGQIERMVSNMQVHTRQRCVTEFILMENTAPIDIQQHLLNVSRDQTVNVSTVRWWVLRFSNGNNGSLLPVQVVTRTACRLLFIAGKNTWLMVVTVLKNSVL